MYKTNIVAMMEVEVLLKRSSTWRQVWVTWTMDNALGVSSNTGGFGGRPSLKNDGERTFRKGSFRELCKYFKKSSC